MAVIVNALRALRPDRQTRGRAGPGTDRRRAVPGRTSGVRPDLQRIRAVADRLEVPTGRGLRGARTNPVVPPRAPVQHEQERVRGLPGGGQAHGGEDPMGTMERAHMEIEPSDAPSGTSCAKCRRRGTARGPRRAPSSPVRDARDPAVALRAGRRSLLLARSDPGGRGNRSEQPDRRSRRDLGSPIIREPSPRYRRRSPPRGSPCERDATAGARDPPRELDAADAASFTSEARPVSTCSGPRRGTSAALERAFQVGAA